jgi:hypothetical protein
MDIPEFTKPGSPIPARVGEDDEIVSPKAMDAWRDRYAKVTENYREPSDGDALRFGRALVIQGGSPVTAYLSAFPGHEHHERSTIAKRARAWANHPLVRGVISEIRKETIKGAVMSERAVLEGLSGIATANIQRILKADGTLLDPMDWPEQEALAIAGVECHPRTGKVVKVKMWSKSGALDALGRHHGLFARDHAQAMSGPLDGLSTDEARAVIRAIEALRARRKPITVESDGAETQHVVSDGENQGVSST